MIQTFAHKGLREFFLSGSKAGVQPQHAHRLRLILLRLDTARTIQDMAFPGSDLHPLKGKRKGQWAVKVSGNWRIVFRFEQEHALDVDYLDYH